jgi:hypothetical protein
MFESSVPVFIYFLKALSGIIGKAEAHCEARKVKPEAILLARLYPDMFPFKQQVQIACDTAKGAGARLAGVAVPSHPDTEESFAELQARIAKTIAFLETLKPEQFADAADRTVTMRGFGGEISFAGDEYLSYFALPNFHFHLTTAYDILRHNGIDIGKRDYMGRV